MPEPTLTLQDIGQPERPGRLNAALISAGAATDSAVDQFKRAYLLARLGIAGPGTTGADDYRAQFAALELEKLEKARLYQPLQAAYPYMTAAGESLPAFAGGLAAGGSAIRFNLGRAALNDLAPQSMMTLRQLAAGLRPF